MKSLLVDLSLVMVVVYSAVVLQSYLIAASGVLILVLTRFLKPRSQPDGASTFPPGTIVTVNRPIDGYHMVDRGTLSTNVFVPLRPGDRLEYRGPYFQEKTVVLIPRESAEYFLARLPKELERTWVAKSAFHVYLPNDAVTLLNVR